MAAAAGGIGASAAAAWRRSWHGSKAGSERHLHENRRGNRRNNRQPRQRLIRPIWRYQRRISKRQSENENLSRLVGVKNMTSAWRVWRRLSKSYRRPRTEAGENAQHRKRATTHRQRAAAACGSMRRLLLAQHLQHSLAPSRYRGAPRSALLRWRAQRRSSVAIDSRARSIGSMAAGRQAASSGGAARLWHIKWRLVALAYVAHVITCAAAWR